MEAFNSFKTLMLKTIINSNYVIDGLTSRLHYKFTVIFLIIFAIVLQTKQYVGGPISCFTHDKGVEYINEYCWTIGIYVVLNVTGPELHPGTGPHDPKDTHNVKYLTYYQWVSFVLFAQAVGFYMPRCVWKKLEGGRVKTIMEKLKSLQEDEKFKNDEAETTKALTDYLYSRLEQKKKYMVKYFICEFLNLVNAVLEIYLINRFLNKQFLNYGFDVVNYDKEFTSNENFNPMSRVFPKVAKCTFKKFGVSGSVVADDFYCVLPLNIVNEKIFLFLWFWYFCLVVITSLKLLYQLTIILCPHIRIVLLRILVNINKKGNLKKVGNFVRDIDLNDWLLIYLTGKNMETVLFKDVLIGIPDVYYEKKEEERIKKNEENSDSDFKENIKNDLNKGSKEKDYLKNFP